MKPRLKPQKGWRFRIIVADENGQYTFDDINMHIAAGDLAHRLMNELIEKTGRGRWKKIQSKERGSQ